MKKTKGKTRCSATMTEKGFNTFIKNLLRGGTYRWRPRSQCKQEARVSRGMYLCNICKEAVPLKDENKKNNVWVDHINPVVCPKKGFEDWNVYIERMFCEIDNLQLLCTECHNKKTAEERNIRKAFKE